MFSVHTTLHYRIYWILLENLKLTGTSNMQREDKRPKIINTQNYGRNSENVSSKKALRDA